MQKVNHCNTNGSPNNRADPLRREKKQKRKEKKSTYRRNNFADENSSTAERKGSATNSARVAPLIPYFRSATFPASFSLRSAPRRMHRGYYTARPRSGTDSSFLSFFSILHIFFLLQIFSLVYSHQRSLLQNTWLIHTYEMDTLNLRLHNQQLCLLWFFVQRWLKVYLSFK